MFWNRSNKSNAKPVAGKPYHIGWPGYEGEMDWGPLFVMQWPKEHPDTHCQKHAYTPDEHGTCVCGWMPADKICCTDCKELLRYKFEKMSLQDMINESNYDRKDLLYTAYRGYVDKYSGQLTGTPDLKAVVKWYDKLSKEEWFQIQEKYLPREGRMVVTIRMGSLGNLSDLIEADLETIMRNAPREFLEHLAHDLDIPEEFRKKIEAYLKKGKEKG